PRSAPSPPAALRRACRRRLQWVTSTKPLQRPVNGFSARYAESGLRCKSAICLSSRIATNATEIEPRRSIAMLKFTQDHEWLRIEGDIATVGITDHAQDQLGDLVFSNYQRLERDPNREQRRRSSNPSRPPRTFMRR